MALTEAWKLRPGFDAAVIFGLPYWDELNAMWCLVFVIAARQEIVLVHMGGQENYGNRVVQIRRGYMRCY
jgi:hypothetical protein